MPSLSMRFGPDDADKGFVNAILTFSLCYGAIDKFAKQ